MKHFRTTFFFLRLPLAVSLLGHGLVRIPKLEAFSGWMMQTMEKSMIPNFLLLPFSYLLPFAELLIGIWLLAGYQIRWALYSGLVLMAVLILGSCSIENWSAIEAQLLHSAYLFALLWFWQKHDAQETN